MQKKSFLIKDILKKLNEDDSLKNQQNCSKFVNNFNEKHDDLGKNLKKIPMINSNQLIFDWHSLAMAAMTQNSNALTNPKTVFDWNKFNLLNQANLPEEISYLHDQSKLRNYFPFNSLSVNTVNLNTSELINNQKRKFDCLLDEVEISENSSDSSICESFKFSDDDARSETSSLISIENTDDGQTNLTINDSDKTSGQNSKKDEKKKRKNRRNRTVFTELQLMGLERRFDSQKYLSTPDRAELANALGLSQLQVKTWYQNRRMKWKKLVMQNGCQIAPTKPKGRPKKGTIPSLGLTFDTSSLLSAMELRKNSTIGKEINSKISGSSFLNRKLTNSDNLLYATNVGNMNQMIKDLSSVTANSQQSINQTSTTHLIQNDINQQFFNQVTNDKIDNFVSKKAKLIAF